MQKKLRQWLVCAWAAIALLLLTGCGARATSVENPAKRDCIGQEGGPYCLPPDQAKPAEPTNGKITPPAAQPRSAPAATAPATPFSALSAQTSAAPQEDRSDPDYVYSQVKAAISTKDASLLQAFIKDPFYFSGSIFAACDGSEERPYASLETLSNHLQAVPRCEGLVYDGASLTIWYSGWQPDLDDCFGGGTSDLAAFDFIRGDDGNFYLYRMFLRDMDAYHSETPGTRAYTVIPCDIAAIPKPERATCPGAPPQRLVPGERGKVCTAKEPVVLRQGKGRTAPRVAALPTGTEFEVLGGGYCIGDGWSWYLVETDDGQIGFISEGGDAVDDYFLCPLE